MDNEKVLSPSAASADGKDKDKDLLASELHSSLRRRRSSSAIAACDSCRSLKARCDRKDPCGRCVHTGKTCTRNHVLLKTGRISRAERTAFELSGLNFKTWRQRLRDQRKEYGYEMRVSADGDVKGKGKGKKDASLTADQRVSSSLESASSQKSVSSPAFSQMLSTSPSGGDDVIWEDASSVFSAGSPLAPPPRPSAHAPWYGMTPSSVSGMSLPDVAGDAMSQYSDSCISPAGLTMPNSFVSPFSGGDSGSSSIWAGSGTKSNGYFPLADVQASAPPQVEALPDQEVEGLFFEPLFSSVNVNLSIENWGRVMGNAHESFALYFQPSGMLRFVEDHEGQATVRELFSGDWSTVGAGDLLLEPPWSLINAETDLTSAITLWPISNFTESDYDKLRSKANSMLASVCAVTLIKRYFATQHLVFPYMYSPTVFHFLESVIGHAHGAPSIWTPVQTRQRQALLLAIAAAASFIDETHAAKVTLKGTESMVKFHSREWAWEAFKLSYALCQPRMGCYFEDDEKTMDLALMGRTWLLPMGYHPSLEGIVVLMSKHFLGDPSFHAAIIQKHGHVFAEMEQWKRIANDAFMAQNHHKLWKDINYDLDIGPVVQLLGPLRLIPGELLSEGMDGASSKLCMWFYFQDTKLQFILDHLCRSSLCRPPTGLDNHGLATQQEIDAETIFNKIKQWNEQTFNPPREYQALTPLKNAQEKLAVRYMMFSARAKMSAALDLIMCTLENDALGLQELRSSANPANSAPSEVDKVAEWIGNSFFYRTEKSYMRKVDTLSPASAGVS